MALSKYRQNLRRLFEEERQMLSIFLGRKWLIKGGLYKTRTKCGKKGCKCEKAGELHIVWKYYRSEKGQTLIRSVKKEDIFRYEEFTGEYRKFRRARARLVKIHRQQIGLIDRLEMLRMKDGKK